MHPAPNPSTVPESRPYIPDLPSREIGFTRANTATVNHSSGAVHIDNPDGSVLISFGDSPAKDIESEFGDNLASILDDSVLNVISEEVLRGIEEDLRSRSEWESTLSNGIDLLGLKLEAASSDVSAQGTVSKVYDPLLIEAVVLYAAKAQAELLPASGPVKIRDDVPESDAGRIQLAEAFEKDFNHYLTVTREEYYPDTERMLFAQGLCGNGFKKIFRCPIRKAPVSDYVAAKDLIISNDAVSLTNAQRITHRTMMRHAVMKRLQLSGHYRKVALGQPSSQVSELDRKIGETEGVTRQAQLPGDFLHTIYETYIELDIDGFKHKDEDGEETGMPLPYRITIDKDSHKVLELRRNWKEGDADYMARRRFVKYGYIPGLGFYDYGLLNLLGQSARSLTAIDRQLIDAGQFSNFPGFLLSDQGGRQESTQIRVPPGGGMEIKCGGLPINQIVMALPYKEPSTALVNIRKVMEDNARRLGGTNEVQVGEGRADVPVGTTIALIEQSTKIEGAVHKRNHRAQQQEFILLKELFEEEPEALVKFNKNPARKWQTAQEIADRDLVPASDANTPSHIHRIMKATGLYQMVKSDDASEYNMRAVRSIVLSTLGYSPSAILAPATQIKQPQQGDPAKMAAVQVKQAQVEEKNNATMLNAQVKAHETALQMQDRQAERESRERIQHAKVFGVIAQQEGQARADEIKSSRGFQAEHFGRQQEQVHGLVQQRRDHEHALEEQGREHEHEKSLAESNSNMIQSPEQ